MKPVPNLLGTACILALTFLPLPAMAEPYTVFVHPLGNDAWSGTLPAAAADASDGPFATLERARDAVRAARAAGALAHGAMVVLRGGLYERSTPFALSAEDAGTAEEPIVYAAWPGERVRISGGKRVAGLEKVSAPDELARIDPAAHGQVYAADVSALGIADFGSPAGGGAELFFLDAPMTLARWPNEGFAKIAGLVVEDGHAIHGVKGSTVGKVHYEGDRPARWTREPDAWVHGYWFWDWSDQRQPIESIDPAARVLAVKPPYHNYGYRVGQWYYGYNLLCELDRPGEWYLDRAAQRLYFWPTEYAWRGDAVLSALDTLVHCTGASHVTFSGIEFEFARGTAVRAEGGESVVLDGCTVRNCGGGGIALAGRAHGAVGCTVTQVGSTGIALDGGDRATLTPGALFAAHNDIHRYGRVHPMYSPGISLAGVGARVEHNHIHDAPHMGIQFGGNDHRIAFNEIARVCEESNDAGAIYSGRNWTMRGNVIEHNYLHHIDGFEGRGCVGVYLDDMFASAAIVGNVFYKVTRAAFIGGGRDNRIERNLFIECRPALHVDARALNWAHYHADEWIAEAKAKDTLSGIAYTQPPYSVRYPELPRILDAEPKAPEGNTIAHNAYYGGHWDEIELVARPYLDLSKNHEARRGDFRDFDRGDFGLRPRSRLLARGLEPIPFEAIGRFRGAAIPRAAAAGVAEALLARSGLDDAARRALHAALADEAYRRGDAAAGDAHKAQSAPEPADTMPLPLPPVAPPARLEEAPRPGAMIHVAPGGSDAADGSARAPFATLRRAAEAAAALHAAGAWPAGGVIVDLQGGRYAVADTISIGIAATAASPLTIRSRAGDPAHLDGARRAAGFAPAADAAVLARLPEEARGKVLCADVRAQGIEVPGEMAPRGFGFAPPPAIEVYADALPLTPARWPNEGWARVGAVTDAGSAAEGRGAAFAFAGDRPLRWAGARDAVLHGYWAYDWADARLALAGVDAASRQLRTREVQHYGIAEGAPYYASHLLEEIDAPGEWYLDREAGTLYLWPPDDFGGAVDIPLLAGPFLALHGASHVRIEGLAFAHARAGAIAVAGGSDCTVARCSVERIGGTAIEVHGGLRHRVLECTLETLGCGGVYASGGDRPSLTPGGHAIERCTIRDFSRIDRTYTPAVRLEGVGNRIAHNIFSGSPGHAMRIEGNDHRIEFNQVYDVVRETDDQGALDMWGDPAYRGNIIRYNFWHDIGGDRKCGQSAIRLDDAICGTYIYGNVFARCGTNGFGAVQIHGGKENRIENNLFFECDAAVSFSHWGAKRWTETLRGDLGARALGRVDIARPPYAAAYPQLAQLEANADVNVVARNALFACGALALRDPGVNSVYRNAIDPAGFRLSDPAGGDFRTWGALAAAARIGFAPIPFASIGPAGAAFTPAAP